MADSTILSTVTVTAAAPKATEGAGVRTFQPKCSIKLFKNIGRTTAGADIAASQRYTGSTREIDLTPFLGTDGAVIATRSTRQPAGMWSATFSDRLSPGLSDSVYGLAEPNDLIEIRMARDPSVYGGGAVSDLPVMMRGFVSEIGHGRIMTKQGPQRAVTISGQDYGKALQMMRITYLPAMVLGQDLLTAYKAFMNYGLEFNVEEDAASFIEDIIFKCVNPFLHRMKDKAANGDPSVQSAIMDMLVDATQGSGVIAPFGVQDWPGGSVYDLMKYFGDVGPWNEMFVEDRDPGPFLVYRPTPFRDLSGSMIQATASDPGEVVVTDTEIIDDKATRSDADVSNYFWVDAQRFTLIDGALIQAASAGGANADWFLKDYPNSSPDLYGVRLMEVQSQQGRRLDGQPETDLQQGRADAISGIEIKRNILKENNRDNVVLETGSLELRGNERVKAGIYLRTRRGSSATGNRDGLESTCYAHTVRHTYQVGSAYLTSVEFDRGTGFVERIQRGSGADGPYRLETNLGGVYGN